MCDDVLLTVFHIVDARLIGQIVITHLTIRPYRHLEMDVIHTRRIDHVVFLLLQIIIGLYVHGCHETYKEKNQKSFHIIDVLYSTRVLRNISTAVLRAGLE